MKNSYIYISILAILLIVLIGYLLSNNDPNVTNNQTNNYSTSTSDSFLAQSNQLQKIDENKIQNSSSSVNSTNTATNSNSNLNNKIMDKKSYTVTMHTNLGDIELNLNGERTPNTVANFVKLASEDFYNGTRFHRVIKDFMIQGGDPLSKDVNKKDVWGTGGPNYMFRDEVYADDNMVEGDLAMANSGPNTNGSQFFIVTAESTPWLNGKHTKFGKVTKGMDIVNKIENSKTGLRDVPVEDVIIKSIDIK
jgi:cyclophilin family peptidyl-prolyl cis-trans isomerase